jgi:hypothetical protein
VAIESQQSLQVDEREIDERAASRRLELQLRNFADQRRASQVVLRQGLFTRSDRVNQGLLLALGFSPERAAALDELLVPYLTRFNQLERANATLTRHENGFRIDVMPFMEGVHVYDRMLNDLTQLLGPTLTPAFQEVFGPELDEILEACSSFTEINVERLKDDQYKYAMVRSNNHTPFLATEPQVVKGRRGLEQLPGLRHLSDLLPPDL